MVKISEIILAIISFPIAIIVLLFIGGVIAIAVNEIDNNYSYSNLEGQQTLDDYD